MTYPTLPEYQGVPTEYQTGASWVADSSYQGGGYWSNEAGYQYSYAQLEKLWDDAGGNPQVAPDMAYIAEYDESGGYAGAWNSSGATGLWQIEWPSNYGGNRQDLFTPLVNAQEAVKLYNSGGFSPWGSDKYSDLNIPAAGSVPYEDSTVPGGSTYASNKPPSSGSGGNSGTGNTQSGSGSSSTTSLLSSLLNGEVLQRFGLIIFGGALILLGVFMFTNKHTFKLAPIVIPERGGNASQSKGSQNQGSDGS